MWYVQQLGVGVPRSLDDGGGRLRQRAVGPAQGSVGRPASRVRGRTHAHVPAQLDPRPRPPDEGLPSLGVRPHELPRLHPRHAARRRTVLRAHQAARRLPLDLRAARLPHPLPGGQPVARAPRAGGGHRVFDGGGLPAGVARDGRRRLAPPRPAAPRERHRLHDERPQALGQGARTLHAPIHDRHVGLHERSALWLQPLRDSLRTDGDHARRQLGRLRSETPRRRRRGARVPRR